MKKTVVLVLTGFAIWLLASCQDATKAIVSVEEPEPLHVTQFTSFDALELPEEVRVTLIDGDTLDVRVAWDGSRGRYASNRIDAYVLQGDLIVAGDVLNRDGLKATITVHVVAEDIIATLEAHGGFSRLLGALDATGLTQTVRESDGLTLFAPNDAAFSAFLDVLDIDETTLHDAAWLHDALLYHLLERAHTLSTLIGFTPMSLDSAQGEAIRFEAAEDRLRLNETAHSTGREYTAENGMIHEIDAVLVPVSVLAEIGIDLIPGRLTAVLFDLIASGDVPLDLLSGLFTGDGGGVTLFLPDEAALNDLASTLDITLESLLASPVFLDVLLYHIVADAYLTSDLFSQAPFELDTLSGEALEITLSEQALQIGGAAILTSETLFDIGYVHVLDAVLIPPALRDSWPDVLLED